MANNYDKTDEATLIRDCLRNKTAAQKAFYERYSAGMMGVCYRYVKNPADAEDVLQEGFIKVFTRLEQYRFSGSLEGWIRRIMVTTAINHLKKNRYFQQNLEIENAIEVSAGVQTDQPVQNKDMIETIRALPPGYRTILNLYAVEGYSHKEIGELLGIGESTSRSQYARAKTLLSKMITEKQKVAVTNAK